MKASILPVGKNLENTIINFLKDALDKKCFDAVIIPKRVPSEDSFAYLLIKDKSILEDSSPLSPVIPVQGAKAISNLTRLGKVKNKILAVMHPCEIRATIELYKLKQACLGNIFFLSFDCSGIMNLSEYLIDPAGSDQAYQASYLNWNNEKKRPVCQICTEFVPFASDLHIGLLGADEGKIFLIPISSEGEEIMNSLGLKIDDSVEKWEEGVKKLKKEREEKREKAHKALKTEVEGPDKFLAAISKCINCHNCMRVCPICYCRQCYFESDAFKYLPDNYIKRAEKKGSLRLPAETLLFHLGRMSHMVFSCVSCGTCEDACPMDIPIAQIFSLAADKTQKLFDYVAGRSKDEPLPNVSYQEEELEEVEKPYTETYVKTEEKIV
ncbi:MAG: 4Fe-4S dicluster domain-containing protein [Acidobacteriota bacterium]